MTAIILAAGRGRRLNPLTENCPKCLTNFDGMTLIGRQIATLRQAGVVDIVIVTGYRGDMLALPGTRRVDNPYWAATNMVESLFCAEGAFGSDVIVSYGDIVYEPRVLARLLRSPHDIAVVVDRQWRAYWQARFADPLTDAESLRLAGDGRIIEIGNPVADLNHVEAQYIGLMRFRNAGIQALRAARDNLNKVSRPWMAKRSVANAYMTDVLMEMVLMGADVHAVPVDGGWLEFDTVADYEMTAAMVADGRIARFFDSAATPARA